MPNDDKLIPDPDEVQRTAERIAIITADILLCPTPECWHTLTRLDEGQNYYCTKCGALRSIDALLAARKGPAS